MITGDISESFYVHLPSDLDAGGLYNKRNTPAHYTVPLKQTLLLADDFEVGLAELFSPSVTYNIVWPNNQDIICWRPVPDNPDDLTGPRTMTGTNIKIAEGAYSPEAFCDAVSKAMRRVDHFSGQIGYHRPSRKISFHLPFNHRIEIKQPDLQNMMGKPDKAKNIISNRSPYYREKIKIKRPWGPANFNTNGPFMYIYSDVAQSSHVGNTEAPILRAVSLANMMYEEETTIHREYSNIQYYPIRHTSINRIEVQLCNSFGRNMPFQKGVGKTLLVLHFRKIKKRGPERFGFNPSLHF